MYPGVVRWHAPAGSVFVHLVVRLAGHDGHAVLELEVAVVGPNIFHLSPPPPPPLALAFLPAFLGLRPIVVGCGCPSLASPVACG
jgi:hypothetical protein